jgi:hypothetical protein
MAVPVLKSEDVLVYDDVLPPDRFAALFRHLNGLRYASVHTGHWHKVWRLHDGNPLSGRATWFHPGPTAPAQPRTPRYPTDTPLDRLVEWMVDHLPEVAPLVGEAGAWDALSLAPWIYPAGSALSLHRDGTLYTGAFTYFAHPRWKLPWGGCLLVLDPATPHRGSKDDELSPAFLDDQDETARVFDPGLAQAILPKPNRIVFISPTAQHTLTRVDATAGQAARVSIAGFFHKHRDDAGVTPPAAPPRG